MSFSSARLLACIALFLAQSLCNADDRGADPPLTPEAVYGQGVRETNKRSPEEERLGFHLPTGFVAELIAAEPAIAKPLNMAFDKHGRLWITDTTEYPYPAAPGTPAHDSIKVLSDSDQDGTFESVTTFADGLNIPIGILPVEDGVICFSIPNIMYLKDADGDGRCDDRKVILGPFDTSRDTHGMVNALRRGADGWIYACHGFNNQSHVKAADGSEIHLVSGNTFRFRADGSHVEQFTGGQVNPFGMTSDEWGNWYTADCHSKPVTLLVRGGRYESFGRPHDGLGFVPSVMSHLHGSTAICGINYYMADNYPEEFRNRFYSGNVMTSRINCNRLFVDRNYIRLVEDRDFMTSDDPWFRPVDLQLGPDGALYVADFYNKIIGHYEVPLEHPDRDRNSGRIWRIAYRGGPEKPQASSDPARPHVPAADDVLLSPAHLSEMAHPNASRRSIALERFNGAALNAAQQNTLVQLTLTGTETSEALRVSALWALHRVGLDTEERLAAALASNVAPGVQVAVLKAWEDRVRSPVTAASEPLRSAARNALTNDVPQVALAGAAALSQHGTAVDVRSLMIEVSMRPGDGSIVQHSMRIALKSLLQRPDVIGQSLATWRLMPRLPPGVPTALPIPATIANANASSVALDDAAAAALADILPAVDTPRAAEALLSYCLSSEAATEAYRAAALKLACKHMLPEFAEPVLRLLITLDRAQIQADAELFSDAHDEQTALAVEAINTLRTGRHAIPIPLSALVETKTARLVTAIGRELSTASSKPLMWHEAHNKLWQPQDRVRRGEAPRTHKFLSSLTLGEAYVGTLSTSVFPCPPELTFWIVGHDGQPKMPAGQKNGARLVHAETGAELVMARPPRNDVAREVRWNLAAWQGQPVRFECFDQDAGNAYAWLGVGSFSLTELNPSPVDTAMGKLAKLIELNVSDVARAQAEQLLSAPALSDIGRARLAAGLATSRGLTLSRALINLAELRGQTAAVKKEIVIGSNVEMALAWRELATHLAAHMTLSQQTLFARSLIASAEGRRLLIELVDEGRVAPDSLRGLKELLQTAAGEADSQRLVQLSDAASVLPSEAELRIVKRVTGFKRAATDVARGQLLFEKNCANCHKLRGAGQLVGPQLDGVGPRGLERLAEDVLLPNRNVDKAFRMSSLLLDDDRVIVGLLREAGAGQLQVVGTDGKTQNVDPGSIEMRKDTTRSLMPDNFSELMSDEDLANLLHFIMQP